jgi:hypothetical protein
MHADSGSEEAVRIRAGRGRSDAGEDAPDTAGGDASATGRRMRVLQNPPFIQLFRRGYASNQWS